MASRQTSCECNGRVRLALLTDMPPPPNPQRSKCLPQNPLQCKFKTRIRADINKKNAHHSDWYALNLGLLLVRGAADGGIDNNFSGFGFYLYLGNLFQSLKKCPELMILDHHPHSGGEFTEELSVVTQQFLALGRDMHEDGTAI